MKINREKMGQIGAAIARRRALRTEIRSQLSNEALAARFGVNIRTIERLVALHKEPA